MRFGVFCAAKESVCRNGAVDVEAPTKSSLPRAAGVVGPYLNPPLNTVLLSADEKPGIQRSNRTPVKWTPTAIEWSAG
jgi:hypothetical protein